ncbi:MAG: epoxyqueuosine reductase [Clostridia bacterium]|nr:epoxyqueuosine reductase [Clostridia bacterium]
MFNIKELPFYDLLPVGVCDFNELKDDLIPCRAISRIPTDAKSVIVYLFPYYLGEAYYENSNISKYAVPDDYHKICGEYLEKAVAFLKEKYPDNSFQYFCDNSPLNEVKAACISGLGVKGENSLLINEAYGSFCFIGEIITDLKIVATKNEIKSCLKCGACNRKCINNALISGEVDKEKCLSSITQKKGELTQSEAELIRKSGCIWGCDICQNVCPMNKNIKTTPIKEFYENAKANYQNEADYNENRAFSWRKPEVIYRNLKILCCKIHENQL